ncbi:Zn(II)2Cys6 transcription factor [Penicillium macrosclerotiorum]|uniref:Zn(II)2Cys6 transcription factor n=1 Tax=Penicillium macrosclerotiorum TaxID=303699 RepID=UPI0025479203|nr:Zn(II)2Cys6 transcription factor [Penicillium macrosclerotiorum]KAJ5698283.1 Zn(II)2Cys6 transcription factor [Penicillium macrosclerotiorum]
MGTSQHMFLTIYRISILTQDLASHISKKVRKAKSELILIERSLDSFQGNSNVDKSKDSGVIHDAITSEMYRLACLIHVKRLLAPDMPDEDATIQLLVANFIEQLQQLPSDSPAHNILSWPLVVAGYSSTIKAHQKIISWRLCQIHQEWQSDIFSLSATFLQATWRKERGMKCARSELTTVERSTKNYASIWRNLPVILA